MRWNVKGKPGCYFDIVMLFAGVGMGAPFPISETTRKQPVFGTPRANKTVHIFGEFVPRLVTP